jgi:hypothetical protein
MILKAYARINRLVLVKDDVIYAGKYSKIYVELGENSFGIRQL